MLTELKNIVRLLLVALPLSSFDAAIAADKGETVANQMLKCLRLPENRPDNFEMTAQIAFKNGSAEFVSINFRAPPTDWEKIVAPAIAAAVTDCEPYGDISGQVSFPVTPELLNSLNKK